MPRVLFTIQYRGTAYAGWQRQENATGIQHILEDALTSMFGQSIHLEGAGRTDSGVHAEAQQAHADIPVEISERGLLLGINNLLPHDIRVRACRFVPPAFHCRFDPHRKTYVYRLWNEPVADAFLFETHAHVPNALDVTVMQEGAQALVGRHDFSSFTVNRPEVSSTWRTIDSISVRKDGSVVEIEVTADGFIRYMVRRIAGLLIEIGRGKVDCGGVRRALEPELQKVRWTAPPEGLTLLRITYLESAEVAESLC